MCMYILELLTVLCMYDKNKIRLANLINGLVYPATFKGADRICKDICRPCAQEVLDPPGVRSGSALALFVPVLSMLIPMRGLESMNRLEWLRGLESMHRLERLLR